jgi:hypothetical protein
MTHPTSPLAALASVVALLGAVLVSTDAAAEGVAEGGWVLQVTSVGPRPIQVEISAGVVAPCDASSDVLLYRGALLPNTAVRVRPVLGGVCVRQTYDNFPDVNWSPSTFHQRPVVCTGAGRARRCRPDPDATLRLIVRSDQP